MVVLFSIDIVLDLVHFDSFDLKDIDKDLIRSNSNRQDETDMNNHRQYSFDNRMFVLNMYIENMSMLNFSIRLNRKVVCYWAVVDNIHIVSHVLNFHKINTPVDHDDDQYLLEKQI